VTTLRVIAINDFHGALDPRPDASGRARGGAAAVAGAVARARAECEPPSCQAILLDGGDQFQGTPASNLAYGRPVVEIFNRLDLAAAALGNHEFDWGQDTLRARMRDARYSFLASNVKYRDGRDVPWISNDTLIARGPLRIGIVGVITRETATSAKPTLISDLLFVEPAPIVDSIAALLRARGADVVLVVAHAGAFCGAESCRGEIVDLARRLTPGRVDAIVSGHTHSRVDQVVNGIRIVQALSRGLAIGVMDIPVANPAAATAQVRQLFTDEIAPDPRIARIAGAALADVADRVNRPVARIAARMDRDSLPLGNLIADAFRVRGGGDFGVLNNGSVRADLRAGTATYGDLFEVQPFGNILYRITANGASMMQYFEKLVSAGRPRGYLSGVQVAYDPARPAGNRVLGVRLPDGRALDSAATYTVVINDFMLAGGVGLSFDAPTIRVQPLDLSDLDAFIDYLSALPQPVSAPADARFVQQSR
jgi:2',3'-cyclic-nucleotide 2'-phosphodiesterase (5'-nucleotidase family)